LLSRESIVPFSSWFRWEFKSNGSAIGINKF
jgi:hypothetical protein